MKYLLILLFISIQNFAFSQSEEKQIIETIERFFEGMRKSDSTLIKRSVVADCTLKNIAVDKESNETLIRNESIQGFVKAVGTKKEGIIYDERILSFDVKIDGQMAIAWSPYEFYVNDRFLHCGVNAFTLAHFNGEWKIIAITDTRRRENCKP